MILSKIRLFSFSVRTKQNHFLFYFFNDCICTRFQKFTWIVSFSFKILSCFNVFAGSFCEYQLTFCINIDLRNSKVNCFLNHIIRNSCTSVKYERKFSCELLNCCKSLKTESFPVCRIFSMNVTDTCCKEINAKVCNHLAFLRICAFAHSYNTVFFSTDRTNFCLDRKSFSMAKFNKFCSLLNVFFDRIMRSVKHN